MANWVRYPLPFSERFPPGEHAKWRCDTPLKRGISAIPARYPMKTRQIPPSAILSRKGIARYGEVSRTGPLRIVTKSLRRPFCTSSKDWHRGQWWQDAIHSELHSAVMDATLQRIDAASLHSIYQPLTSYSTGKPTRCQNSSDGVGADGVGVLFPFFRRLQLHAPPQRKRGKPKENDEQQRKTKKQRETKKRHGKIPSNPICANP